MEEQNSNGNEKKSLKMQVTSLRGLDVVLLLAVISFGSILGFLVARFIPSSTSQDAVVKRIEKTIPKDFAVSAEMLADPIYNNWGGRVKGKVQSIDEDSITIIPINENYDEAGKRTVSEIKNGQPLVILISQDSTMFYKSIPNGDSSIVSKIKKSEIPQESLIEGGVELVNQNGKTDIVGRTLTIR